MIKEEEREQGWGLPSPWGHTGMPEGSSHPARWPSALVSAWPHLLVVGLPPRRSQRT